MWGRELFSTQSWVASRCWISRTTPVFPTDLNPCCLQQMFEDAEVRAVQAVGLTLIHPWSCLAWLTYACLQGFDPDQILECLLMCSLRTLRSYPNQSSSKRWSDHHCPSCQLCHLFWKQPCDGVSAPRSNSSSVTLTSSSLSVYCPIQPEYGGQIVSSLFVEAFVLIL